MENKLKSISTTEIESIISQALSSALKEQISVTISAIDFSRHHSMTGGSISLEVYKDNSEFYAKLFNKK